MTHKKIEQDELDILLAFERLLHHLRDEYKRLSAARNALKRLVEFAEEHSGEYNYPVSDK